MIRSNPATGCRKRHKTRNSPKKCILRAATREKRRRNTKKKETACRDLHLRASDKQQDDPSPQTQVHNHRLVKDGRGKSRRRHCTHCFLPMEGRSWTKKKQKSRLRLTTIKERHAICTRGEKVIPGKRRGCLEGRASLDLWAHTSKGGRKGSGGE